MSTKGVIEQQADIPACLGGMWAGAAGGWERNAASVDVRLAPVTDRMLELSGPRSGERVLELAGGPGGVGLAAAERVGPDGQVVISDLVAEMTAIASARAEALGLANVRTRRLDLERIDEPDASYDVVLCREGLMLVPDPGRAAREIRRVLRPGGRLALSVWGPRERNPWIGVIFDAISAQLGAPVPPPGIPGPFSLDDAHLLAALLRDAGLCDVVVEEVAVPQSAVSFEEWWSMGTALAGPIAKRLAALPAAAAEAIRARACTAIEVYATPTGLDIPGVALLAGAHRE